MNDEVLRRLLAAFDDPSVDEVLVNGAHGAWAVGAAGTRSVSSPFGGEDELCDWLLAFAERREVRLDPVVGAAGGSLGDGDLRWHAVLPPLSRDGPLLSLRRHRFGQVRLGDFAGDPIDFARLREAMRRRVPLLIAGPTGSGKTTLLAALLKAEAAEERLVVIESLAELPRLSPYAVRLVARPPGLGGEGAVTVARLLAEALRLRPDRLVIGEIRDAEARAFVEAARAGHGGVMATIHAATPDEALRRLASLGGGIDCGDLPLVVAVTARGRPPRLVALGGHLDWTFTNPSSKIVVSSRRHPSRGTP